MLKKVLSYLLLVVVFNSGCYDIAGLNTQEEKAGNDDGGNSVTDLSLSPEGRFLFRGNMNYDEESENYLYKVNILDLESGNKIKKTFAGGKIIGRIIFGKEGFVYLFTDQSSTYLEELNMETGKVERSWKILGVGKYPHLAIDESNSKIAIWRDKKLMVINVENEKISEVRTENYIIDVKWIENGNKIAAVKNLGFMETKVAFYSDKLEEINEIDVPNCASSLEISPDGLTGMISPVDCNKDPVSIIDLTEREFVKNIPGFGPVAFAPDGSYAVAFGRKDDLFEVAGIETETSYSIIFINTSTYEYEILELGEDLPIYTITPNGELVLLYSRYETEEYKGIFVIDVMNQEVRYSDNQDNKYVPLDEFVMTPDSESAFILNYTRFYKLNIKSLNISEIELDCRNYYEESLMCRANQIMIKPDGSKIILGMVNGNDFAMFDPEKMEISTIIGM